MHLQSLSIIGVGLLGGSIGLALRSISSPCKIIGYGHRPQTFDNAVAFGAIDEGCTDLATAVHNQKLVVLCTPVGLFPQILRQIAPALTPGTIVTDVGSTKRSIVKLAE